MTGTAFFEAEFFVLLLSSFIAPFCINACVIWKQAISRKVAWLSGNGLLISEISVAPYLVLAVFAGIGVSLISHGLITNLDDAEKKIERI